MREMCSLCSIELTFGFCFIVLFRIVYGTYEHPVKGWVGNASSGHLGFFAGYYKGRVFVCRNPVKCFSKTDDELHIILISISGLFRTIYGNSQSKIDLIPVDYTINASMVLGWYVGTRKLELPEVIHSTSGDVNLLSLEEFTNILNDRVRVHPSLKMVWVPHAKIRNGLRHTVFFYLFHILPTMIWYYPEKLLGLGIRHHTYVGYYLIH